MKSIALRMAKATTEDKEAMLLLIGILDDACGNRPHENPQFPRNLQGEWDDDAPAFFDPDKKEHLRALYDRLTHIIQHNFGAMNRVVWGFDTITSDKNRIIDPDDDCLALHPRFAAMEKELAELKATTPPTDGSGN